MTDNIGMVYSRIPKYINRWPYRRDELISLLMEALCVAVKRFDPNRGFRFSSYAARVMDNYFYKELKTFYKLKNEIGVLDVIKNISREEEGFDVIQEEREESYSIIESKQAEPKPLHVKVTTEKKRLIVEIIIDNPTLNNKEIAELAKCSIQYVGQVRKEVREDG